MRLRTIPILALLAAVPAALMTYIAASHNAMQEFCAKDSEAAGGCVLDLGHVLTFFSLWYLLALAVLVAAALALRLAVVIIRRLNRY